MLHGHRLIGQYHASNAVLPVASNRRRSAAGRAPAKEEGFVAAAQKTSTRIPPEDYHSHLNPEEHAEKINKYQATLAARLKANHFSTKALEKGDVFEEIVIQSETIQLSRWPFTRLFADPAKVYREKSRTAKYSSTSLADEAMSQN